MFLNPVKNRFLVFFCFIAVGCGLGTPTSGHDPNKPLPVIISDNAQVPVDHSIGAIITTPDGKAVLAITQTALSANTSFGISLYILPQGSPRISIDQMYSFTPVTVSALIAQQVLIVTLLYDPTLIPAGIQEADLRLAVFDSGKGCWSQVFLDSPSVIPGKNLHQVNSKTVTQLGIFGVTTVNTKTCPNLPITF